MQDNNFQNEYDSTFVQKSWSDLRDKLDNEMPVVVPRSRKIAYILGVSQLISIAIIGFLLYQAQQKIPFTTLTKTTEVNKNILTVASPTTITNTKTVTQYIPGPTEYIYVNATDYKAALVDKGTLPPSIKMDDLNRIESYQRRNNYVFSKRNLSTRTDVNLEMTHEDGSAEENHMRNFLRNGVDFRIGLLTTVSKDLDYSGYGVITSLQVAINNKFSIGTGLGFNHISREFNVIPLLPKSRNSYNVVVRQVDLDDQTTFYKSLNDFKQILIPISLNYNLSNKFALSSGVKFRHTFNSSVNRNLKSELKQSISTVNNPETLFFNDTNFGLSFGINYSPSQRITLQIDSEIGINSLINSNQFKSIQQSRYDLQLINFTTNYSF